MNDAQTVMMYDATKKSLPVTYILWWFLGTFGAHRFYMGRTGSGIAMLVITLLSIPLTLIFVGIIGFMVVGVWWIVDAFLIPGIVRDSNMRLAAHLSGGRDWG
jgi:TM2 domain-containing membrane protein YozV